MRIFARAQRRESVFHARESVYRAETHCNTLCCSVLQCVTVCCSLLQCARTSECVQSRDTLQHTLLQCVAVCCSVLQCVAVCCSAHARVNVYRAETHCNTLLTLQHTLHSHTQHYTEQRHTATRSSHCNTLPTLQHTPHTYTQVYTWQNCTATRSSPCNARLTLQHTPHTHSPHCNALLALQHILHTASNSARNKSRVVENELEACWQLCCGG